MAHGMVPLGAWIAGFAPSCSRRRTFLQSAARVATLVARCAAHSRRLDKLVLTVQETAEMLGLSDDLVYELTAQGALPWLHLGRWRVIPRRAVELTIEQCLGSFSPKPSSPSSEGRPTAGDAAPSESPREEHSAHSVGSEPDRWRRRRSCQRHVKTDPLSAPEN